jgi:protein-S-isoprenylcysteine O-methyltransferase Ste14
MIAETSTHQAMASAARKWRVKSVILSAVLAAILIGGSGRIDWVGGWVYVLVVTASPLATYRMLAKRSPDLVVERAKIQAGTKSWDKVLAPLVALVFPLAMWIVAALDRRYGWSRISAPLEAGGFVMIVLGVLLILWAMAENRFFAATVRIQKDRGQRVVCDGPYAYVRHPGYVGMLAYELGTPLALGSVYAAAPAALCAAALVLRTALEDRTLRAELEGYTDYSRRVGARLIPGVW